MAVGFQISARVAIRSRHSTPPVLAPPNLLAHPRFLVMAEAFKILFCILCSPCICIGLCLRSRRPQNLSEKPEVFLERRRKNAPPPLPARERSLTLPLPAPKFNVPTTVQKTHPQVQAALLSQIPLEVRRMIYEEVLGGEVIQILRKQKKLAHYVCRVRHAMWSDRACVGPTDRDGLWVGWTKRIALGGGLLPLLMTCRKV